MVVKIKIRIFYCKRNLKYILLNKRVVYSMMKSQSLQNNSCVEFQKLNRTHMRLTSIQSFQLSDRIISEKNFGSEPVRAFKSILD